MSRLPWILMPLLFLPNLGLLKATRFGALEISDFLIWPYLAVLIFALKRCPGKRVKHRRNSLIYRLMLLFVVWAFLSTITEVWRYDYLTDYPMQFGLLKLGKLLAYGVAGVLTMELSGRQRDLRGLLWALTGGGIIMAVSLPFVVTGVQKILYDVLHGYKAVNSVSVGLAIIIVFLGIAWTKGWGDRLWRKVFPVLLVGMTFGFVYSSGRGGWLAALIGLIVFAFRENFHRRILVMMLLVLGVIVTAYECIPAFHYQLERTINPSSVYIQKHGLISKQFDDSGRFALWWQEGRKLIDAPLLGRGFYNRFPASGLEWTGSHSFWLQMFLETGVPGGSAILVIMWLMWKESRRRHLLPVEAAILVAFIGCLGGEYFYGGIPLFSFLVACSPLWFPETSAIRSPAVRSVLYSTRFARRFPIVGSRT